ncbi:hypothetical protein A2U01_0096767, partial [Trifolium medium]|nr:hypothetical protein [Trifolium medium]
VVTTFTSSTASAASSAASAASGSTTHPPIAPVFRLRVGDGYDSL